MKKNQYIELMKNAPEKTYFMHSPNNEYGILCICKEKDEIKISMICNISDEFELRMQGISKKICQNSTRYVGQVLITIKDEEEN